MEYGAYTFCYVDIYWNTLHNIFLTRFGEGLLFYPEGYGYHKVLMINNEDYLGYKGYVIHKGSRNAKTAKFKQRKIATRFEHKNLALERRDIEFSNDFINYAEQITTLQVFNMKILQQRLTWYH